MSKAPGEKSGVLDRDPGAEGPVWRGMALAIP